MATNAERFFDRLTSVQSLRDLIGLSEDADFDCKEWRGASGAKASIAKAACGFTNATGGVIVIGLNASGRGPDIPDVVKSLTPVADRNAVASEALDIVLKFVEPGIEGVKIKTFADDKGELPGFVAIFIPESDGGARRSKVDWRFYVRVASGTIPMEYFQIEERFGKRPPPRLSLFVEIEGMIEASGHTRNPLRHILFGLTNESRTIAKFPGVRFKRTANLQRYDFGIDGNGGFGLPPRASEYSWIVFRGGVDDVIYPGETRKIGKLIQTANNSGEEIISPAAGQIVQRSMVGERLWICEAGALEYEISAEGSPTVSKEYPLQEAAMKLRFNAK
jgi:hypothetical protein